MLSGISGARQRNSSRLSGRGPCKSRSIFVQHAIAQPVELFFSIVRWRAPASEPGDGQWLGEEMVVHLGLVLAADFLCGGDPSHGGESRPRLG